MKFSFKKLLVIGITAAIATLSAVALSACGEKPDKGMTFNLNDSGDGYIVGYSGTCKQTELVIPAEHEGLPIVGVKKGSFDDNKYIRTVTFEPTATMNIGKEAFDYSTALQKIIFVSGDVVMGENAFSNLSAALEIEVGSANITTSGSSFYNTKIVGVDIGKGGSFVLDDWIKKSCEITVCNGSVFTYPGGDRASSVTVIDDLYLSSTKLEYTYKSGSIFKKTQKLGAFASTINLPSTLTAVPENFFGTDGKEATVNFGGTREQWEKVYVPQTGNSNFFDGKITVNTIENMSFEVSFKDIEGNEIGPTRTVKYGSLIPEPNIAPRPGKKLVKWFTDSEFTQAWDKDNYLVTGNVTLYALYLDDSHEHAFTEEVIAPTCTGKGYTRKTCDCIPGKYSEVIIENYVDQLGHDYDATNATWQWTDYTATATVVCKRDGCTGETEGHVHVFDAAIVETVITPSTCRTQGSAKVGASFDYGGKTYDCPEKKDKTLPLADHTEVSDDNAVESTCTETGLTASSHCSVCGVEIKSRETMQKKPHTRVGDGNAVAATCTFTGLTESAHCSVCGMTIEERQETPKLPHTEVGDGNAVAPTCTATGLTESTHCSVCGLSVTSQKEVAMTPHTVVTDAAVAPTCTATGLTQGSHCSACNAVIVAQTEVAMIPHSIADDALHCATCDMINTEFTAITTVAQLQNINVNLGKKYYLANDLDLANQNWTPIGTGYGDFTGVFDGNGKTIKNLSYSVENDNGKKNVTAGLFAVNAGIIRNVKIENVNVNYSFTEHNDETWADHFGNATIRFGAIAGENKKTVSGCTVSGNYNMTAYRRLKKYFTWAKDGDATGDHDDRIYLYYGGVTGMNNGMLSDCTVTASINCRVEGYIESKQGFLGGVSTCLWYVRLFGSVGGIAAENTGTVSKCAMRGALTYTSKLGANCVKNVGVAGWQVGAHIDLNVGSVVGYNDKGNISGSSATKPIIKKEHSQEGQTSLTGINDNVKNNGTNGAFGSNGGGKIDPIELIG